MREIVFYCTLLLFALDLPRTWASLRFFVASVAQDVLNTPETPHTPDTSDTPILARDSQPGPRQVLTHLLTTLTTLRSSVGPQGAKEPKSQAPRFSVRLDYSHTPTHTPIHTHTHSLPHSHTLNPVLTLPTSPNLQASVSTHTHPSAPRHPCHPVRPCPGSALPAVKLPLIPYTTLPKTKTNGSGLHPVASTLTPAQHSTAQQSKAKQQRLQDVPSPAHTRLLDSPPPPTYLPTYLTPFSQPEKPPGPYLGSLSSPLRC